MPKPVRFAFIDAWKEEWPVEFLCRVMQVTPSCFFPSPQAANTNRRPASKVGRLFSYVVLVIGWLLVAQMIWFFGELEVGLFAG